MARRLPDVQTHECTAPGFLIYQYNGLLESFTFRPRRWRNKASTMVSQGMDTVIFISSAIYRVVPSGVFLEMIGARYIAKLLFALADTPFCYLLVGWTRERIEIKPGKPAEAKL